MVLAVLAAVVLAAAAAAAAQEAALGQHWRRGSWWRAGRAGTGGGGSGANYQITPAALLCRCCGQRARRSSTRGLRQGLPAGAAAVWAGVMYLGEFHPDGPAFHAQP